MSENCEISKANHSLDNQQENGHTLPDDDSKDHDEYQYLKLIKQIIQKGNVKTDRTGTGTHSIFGTQMRFSLRDGIFPLLTTKRVFWRGVVEELLWFIKGSTNAKELSDKDIHIWDANSSREFLDSCGFTDREVGDLGPVYGFQWRHFGAKYVNMHTDYTGQGIDQLKQVIDTILNKPDDRRIIMSAWNPIDIPIMALPPCHALPGDFVHSMGDCHVYLNHVPALQEQLLRKPKPFPKLIITRDVKEIDDFKSSDFQLDGYHPHPKISMPMAV
ncbi:unnamed protein product [Trichogramma brassicae]|uniref:Thymidylate synthase n=1 Tax=Trichogramma brassicae TaxID=86971 RepID=A0A6H5IJD2_9HYME|nr:unnamed protein product [Trichogramma brassicae]